MELQQIYPFTLPRGLRIKSDVYKSGSMRLATAKDEMEAMNTPKAQAMPEYVTIALLAKVIQLEGLEVVTVDMIESMYTADVNFLQNMYQTINQEENAYIHVQCPHCREEFDEPLNFTREG